MRAAVCPEYGPPEVLRLAEVPKPSPKDREVLVKIYASTVTVADTRIRAFRAFPGRIGVRHSPNDSLEIIATVSKIK